MYDSLLETKLIKKGERGEVLQGEKKNDKGILKKYTLVNINRCWLTTLEVSVFSLT